MSFFGGRRSQSRQGELPANDREPVIDDPVAELEDGDIPTFESPHVTLLRRSEGGPYYLTPDSAEPLPSGMWADLDPKAVENEAKSIERFKNETGWNGGDQLPQEIRDFLLASGPAARKMLESLEGAPYEPPDALSGL